MFWTTILLTVFLLAYLEIGPSRIKEGLLSTSPGTLHQIRAVGVENKHLYAHSKDAIPSLSSGYPNYYWGYTPHGYDRRNDDNLTYYQARLAGDSGI